MTEEKKEIDVKKVIAFNNAIRENDILLVKDYLLNGYDASESYQNPSNIACAHDRLQILKLLIEFGAEPEKHHSSLRDAAQYGHLEIIEFLLNERNCDISEANNCALNCCIYQDQILVFKKLYEKGANIYAVHPGIAELDSKIPTVFYLSITEHAPQILEFLLKNDFYKYYDKKWDDSLLALPSSPKDELKFSQTLQVFLRHIQKHDISRLKELEEKIKSMSPEIQKNFFSQLLEVRLNNNSNSVKKLKI